MFKEITKLKVMLMLNVTQRRRRFRNRIDDIVGSSFLMRQVIEARLMIVHIVASASSTGTARVIASGRRVETTLGRRLIRVLFVDARLGCAACARTTSTPHGQTRTTKATPQTPAETVATAPDAQGDEETEEQKGCDRADHNASDGASRETATVAACDAHVKVEGRDVAQDARPRRVHVRGFA